MKPFRFRLERLKQLRSQQTDRRRHEFDRACEICDSLNSELRNRAGSHQEREATLETRLQQGLSAASLRSEAADTDRSARNVEEARSQVQNATDQRDDNQNQLFAAWRRMRLLERLEARGRAKHDLEEQRRGQRDLDESGQLRWWGRNR